jgi:hypothetical protein
MKVITIHFACLDINHPAPRAVCMAPPLHIGPQQMAEALCTGTEMTVGEPPMSAFSLLPVMFSPPIRTL